MKVVIHIYTHKRAVQRNKCMSISGNHTCSWWNLKNLSANPIISIIKGRSLRMIIAS
jgi:hypothetical protein